MTKARKRFRPLTSESICNIYELLREKGYVSFPLPEDASERLGSIVSNINGSYFGNESYPAFEEKAVAYLYFIIKNHVFTDGNKRTACYSFSVLCDLNDLDPDFQDFTLDELAVYLEGYRGNDYQELIGAVATLLFFGEGKKGRVRFSKDKD